jgi:CheY-like chemotaxis protein
MHPPDRMSLVIVLFGPPLPGRDLVERALEAALPDVVRIVAGTFATASERRSIARSVDATGSRPLFVAWECSEQEAENEIFHHYVAMPRRQAEVRWREFLDDAARREPPGREAWPRVLIRAGEPLDQAIARVLAAVDADPAPPPVARRVLVVDDDDAQCELVADAFELLGCVVARARDAAQARSLAGTQRFDLLITDYELPGRTGTELAAEVRTVQPDLKVAIVTAHPDEAIDTQLATGGTDLVLAKPVGIGDLVHVLDELARRHHTARTEPS